MYSPDGSSVLLDGVVGGATGISSPGEKQDRDTDEDQFHVYVNPHMCFCLCVHASWCNVHTWVEKDWGRAIQWNENISVALWFIFFFNRQDFSVTVVVEGKQQTDRIVT